MPNLSYSSAKRQGADLQVRELGERGLLARLQQFSPPELVGDDAAVMAIAAGQSLVVTTDMLVDGVHFSDRTTAPEDAGWRAIAANLSDLAAMGAAPLGVTVCLGLPGKVEVSWIERLYQGMSACLQPHATSIVGGDVCRSSVIAIAITAFGQVEPRQTIRRNAAQVGDVIVVTGVHGAAQAGLELLLHPERGQNLSETERLSLIQAHQRPKPRLDVLPLLWEVTDSPRIAGMDSSDGLADAIVQLCQASGVGAKITRSQIPVPAAIKAWSPAQALDYALYGGEDFELVLCLPPEPAMALVQKLGNGAAAIGTITADTKVQTVDPTSKNPDQMLDLRQGFQHF